MNWGVEAIGILAGVVLYGAMAFKTLLIIKLLLLIGAVLFLTYALIYVLPAMIIVNTAGVGIGIYGVISAYKLHKKEKLAKKGA